MTTCPHCGAEAINTCELFTEFACGFDTHRDGVRGAECFLGQIKRLQDLLDNPKAKPLEWRNVEGICQAKSIKVGFGIFSAGDLMRLSFTDFRVQMDFPDLATAQAHAEELHQAEWRETMKWSVYYKEKV